MKIIEFTPKKGILHINFGMSMDTVKEIMKTKYNADKIDPKGDRTYCYFKNSLQFSFEEDNTLSFIEAYSPPPVGIRLLSINTWEIDGNELLDRLNKVDTINEAISEGGSNPIFQNNIIALWDLAEQYDHIGGYKHKKWGAIGIGDERYYKSICDIYK
jgi:hypothetical protein